MVASAAGQVPCYERSVVASAVRTSSDLQAFVQCAYEFALEVGTEEAYRAFHEDDRWRHGQYYIFVSARPEDPSVRPEDRTGYFPISFPPNPAREGQSWGVRPDAFGPDLGFEILRVLDTVGTGWVYYGFTNFADGRTEPKRSYVMSIDWDGALAYIGAGIYARDLPGTCEPFEVNAARLEADPSTETLQAFVRCAAFVAESQGYSTMQELETSPRWNEGSTYVFAMDGSGNQVLSGSKIRVNGQPLHEWGGRSRPGDQFGGRNMVSVGEAFGEAFLYYRALNPVSGASELKVSMVKRVLSGGVPLIIGAGYFPGPGGTAGEVNCSDHTVAAGGISRREEMRAFIECAHELVQKAGTAEAYRAFHEDERWQSGPIYVFVDEIGLSGDTAISRVAPPHLSNEGAPWGRTPDLFDTDLFGEYGRIFGTLGVDSGWVYYAFVNPVNGRVEPKVSYGKAIDWNGKPAYIGAGIYEPDVPGTCDPEEVNASRLEAAPSEDALRQLVRCATLQVESTGLYAAPVLEGDARWRGESVRMFAVNAETGAVVFSADPDIKALSGRIPEALFGGRDVIRAASTFGEMFWYYNYPTRVEGGLATRVAFAKAVRAHDTPLLLVASYSRPQ